MLHTLLSTAGTTPAFLALLGADRVPASFGVLIGIAVIAIVEVAAGLWMVRSGRGHRGIRG